MVDLLTGEPLTMAYHELRAPLGLITTAALAASEETDPVELQRRLKIIARVSERMLRTTERVLALAGAGTPSEPETYAPGMLIAQIVRDFGELALPLTLEVTSSAAAAETFGVPAQLEALVQSLLGNAFDHGETGAPVHVRIDVPGDNLVLAISNPIATSLQHKGLGVGAYLCRLLAEEMGGALRLGPDGTNYRALLRLPVSVPQGIRT